MKRLFSILAGGLLLSTTLNARAVGDRTPSSTYPPLISWKAPAFYTSPSSGRTALTDAASPVPYIPLVPCRQYDSRNSTALADNTPRTVTLSGAPCGIPATAVAVAVNITVFNITGAGSNGVFKVGTSTPPPTAWINYPSSETQRGNAGVLGTTGAAAIVVQVNQGAGSVDFVVDVFGYYGSTPATADNYFTLNTNSNSYTMYLTNASTTCSGACGLYQLVGSGTAIRGVTSSATSIDAGVWGAGSTNAVGVYGTSGSNVGVKGNTSNTANDISGVFGKDGAGAGTSTCCTSAGVRGEGQVGVLGITNTSGSYGVVGVAISPATGAVLASGTFAATGAKSFVEPHPTDPTMTIRYVSLEGPEAGTYFRGTAKTVSCEAVIEVPETFRIVTAEEGLTVQLTPVGELAQMAVITRDLNQIVVRSSREVTFDYHVNGIRRAFKDWQVVAEGQEFRPVSPDQKMPSWLTEEAKSRLISNGTYNPDGTVNMATAERLGWATAWREKAEAAARK
jgi:hypothetical protein